MNTLVCRFALTLAVVRLLCSAPPAYADSFQLTYSGGALSGILNLTATPQAGGSFLVTSISDSQNDSSAP